MKKLLTFLLLITAFTASAQIYQRDPSQPGRSIDRYQALKALHIPTFNGVPNLDGDVITNTSAIAYDSTGHKFYVYDPSTETWGQVTGGGVIIDPGVDSITYHNNQLCQWVSGVSTCYFLNKFYDSTALNHDSTRILHFNSGNLVDSVLIPTGTIHIIQDGAGETNIVRVEDSTRLHFATLKNTDDITINKASDSAVLLQFTHPHYTKAQVDSIKATLTASGITRAELIDTADNKVNKTDISGGTINQVLKKNSSTDYDWSWQDESGGGNDTAIVHIDSVSGHPNWTIFLHSDRSISPDTQKISMPVTLVSLTKNATRDSIIATFSDGNTNAVKDSAGGGGGTPAGSNTYVQYNNSGAFGADTTFRFSPTGFLDYSGTLIGASIKPILTRTSTLGNIVFLDLSGIYNEGPYTSGSKPRMLKFGTSYWNADSLWNISIGSGNSSLPSAGNTFYVGNNAGVNSTATYSVGIGQSAMANSSGANSIGIGFSACNGCGLNNVALGWGALQSSATYTNAMGFSTGKSSTASYSNYLGPYTGMYNAAPYSNLIGTYVGYGGSASHLMGRNLSMIGMGITAPLNNSVDLFNAGNVLYATHTLYNTSTPSSLQRGVGRLGINNPNPQAQISMSPGDSVAGSAPILIPYTNLTITGGNDGATYDTLFFADQTYPPFGDSSIITVAGVTPSAYNGSWLVKVCTPTYVVYSNPGAAGAVTVNGTITQGGKMLTVFKDGAIERDSTGIAFTSGSGTNLQRNFIQKGRSGTATLSSGTVTVNTTYVKANSRIFVFVNTPSGTQGFLSAPSASIVSGTSFIINSTSATESSTVYWVVLNQ